MDSMAAMLPYCGQEYHECQCEDNEKLNLPEFDVLPRAVALDLDGTLLDNRTQLSERSRRALEGCLEQGIPVIIATSRPTRIFNRVFPRELAGSCSLAVMNGAVTIGNPPLSGYFKETISEEIIRSVISLAGEFCSDTHVTLELDGYEFGVNWTPDPDFLWPRNSATLDMVLSIDEALTKQPSKIAVSVTGEDILELKDILDDKFGQAISVIPSLIGNPILNITAPGASKPNALRKLLDPVGISLDEVIAFGDDLPDIGMLEACGISVAMANSFPDVKSVCSHHTASNDDDGVALVLEEMLKRS
ncbi:MAG: HAD family hydrolase [Dehalococcoidales bacterium]